MITMDVATLLAYPPLPLVFQKNEDRRLGVVLLGFNVTFWDAVRFKPWVQWDDSCHSEWY